MVADCIPLKLYCQWLRLLSVIVSVFEDKVNICAALESTRNVLHLLIALKAYGSMSTESIHIQKNIKKQITHTMMTSIHLLFD